VGDKGKPPPPSVPPVPWAVTHLSKYWRSEVGKHYLWIRCSLVPVWDSFHPVGREKTWNNNFKRKVQRRLELWLKQ
jgi:hypothetical protein